MLNLEKVKCLIKSKGWSTAYFCASMGHSRSWLIDIKKGKGVPDENGIKDIADKLDTTIEYLTDKTDIKEQKNKLSSEKDSLSEMQKELLDLFDLLTLDQQKSIVAMARSIAAERRSKNM